MLVVGVAGVSKFMDSHIGIIRQSRDVELKVCNLGKTVSWATVLPQSVDSNSESCQ